jgi:acetylornithine/succinyldiaminopimelate/putrescine aminotransferase
MATMEAILEDGILLSECDRLGKYFVRKLMELKDEYPNIILDVRGKGLLIGVEVNQDCRPLVTECMNRGVLINCTAGSTLRFVPPLIVRQENIDRVIEVLDEVLGRLS